jgi:predicted PurR-regulated permease PerM
MDPAATRPPNSLQRPFLLLTVALVSVLFGWMIRDFLISLLMAALAAALLSPLDRWLDARLGGRRGLTATLVVIATLLLVIGPLTTMLGLVLAQAVQVTQAVQPWVEAQVQNPDQLAGVLDRLPFADQIHYANFLPEREKLIAAAGEAVRSTGTLLINGVAAAGRLTVRFILQLFIFLYALFFFLLQGREVLDQILYYAPLEQADEERVVDRFVSVTRATLKGSIVIGGIQGILTGGALALAGIEGAAFWGAVVVVLSIIPGVGAPIIWIPAAAWLAASGDTASAILLALWCAIVVGTIDNLLRPRLVGGDARMSDLMILISTLGGISLFGAVGFVVGPIVAAVFITIWEVYGRAFADLLPPVNTTPPEA